MTEVEWLASSDPVQMLKFLRLRAGDRKLRLFACACVRRVWSLITDHRGRHLVELAERYADGNATEVELRSVAAEIEAFEDGAQTAAHTAALCVGDGRFSTGSAADVVTSASDAIGLRNGDYDRVAAAMEITVQAALLREVFANPFRPATLDPECRTSTVVAMARGIYDDRAFERMPLLADTLQDAGCGNDAILTHCRGAGPHVRGCWVVDSLLGKD